MLNQQKCRPTRYIIRGKIFVKKISCKGNFFFLPYGGLYGRLK